MSIICSESQSDNLFGPSMAIFIKLPRLVSVSRFLYKSILLHDYLNIIISPGLIIMLKCYLGAYVGTLILIYALAWHIPLLHPPTWAAKAAHYFNISHVPLPPKFLGQIKP